MENQTNSYVRLMDGVMFKTSFVDTGALKQLLDSNRIHVVKVGTKGVVKQQVMVVAEEKHINNPDASVIIQLGQEPYGIVTDTPDEFIDKLINDINNNGWVRTDDGLLFNRSAFQYVEKV